MNTPVVNRRRGDGVKLSADCYRKGGERVLWLDGYTDELTLKLVKAIRTAGFKCWRTRDQVWVNKSDILGLDGAGLGASWMENAS